VRAMFPVDKACRCKAKLSLSDKVFLVSMLTIDI
jgi:hypothetical protein